MSTGTPQCQLKTPNVNFKARYPCPNGQPEAGTLQFSVISIPVLQLGSHHVTPTPHTLAHVCTILRSIIKHVKGSNTLPHKNVACTQSQNCSAAQAQRRHMIDIVLHGLNRSSSIFASCHNISRISHHGAPHTPANPTYMSTRLLRANHPLSTVVTTANLQVLLAAGAAVVAPGRGLRRWPVAPSRAENNAIWPHPAPAVASILTAPAGPQALQHWHLVGACVGGQ
jgi:hypothetical protein